LFNLHIKEEVGTVRIFGEGGSYENKTNTIFSCTIHYIADNEVFICAARGKIPKGGFAYFMRELKKKGINIVRYERQQKMKTLHL
jgi:hypothetical protein